jgi:hypothetical protein
MQVFVITELHASVCHYLTTSIRYYWTTRQCLPLLNYMQVFVIAELHASVCHYWTTSIRYYWTTRKCLPLLNYKRSILLNYVQVFAITKLQAFVVTELHASVCRYWTTSVRYYWTTRQCLPLLNYKRSLFLNYTQVFAITKLQAFVVTELQMCIKVTVNVMLEVRKHKKRTVMLHYKTVCNVPLIVEFFKSGQYFAEPCRSLLQCTGITLVVHIRHMTSSLVLILSRHAYSRSEVTYIPIYAMLWSPLFYCAVHYRLNSVTFKTRLLIRCAHVFRFSFLKCLMIFYWVHHVSRVWFTFLALWEVCFLVCRFLLFVSGPHGISSLSYYGSYFIFIWFYWELCGLNPDQTAIFWFL